MADPELCGLLILEASLTLTLVVMSAWRFSLHINCELCELPVAFCGEMGDSGFCDNRSRDSSPARLFRSLRGANGGSGFFSEALKLFKGDFDEHCD